MSDLDFNKSLEWFRSKGGILHPNLIRKQDENGIYGMFATGPINEGDILCQVPNECAITDKLYKSPDTWDRKLKMTYCLLRESINPSGQFQTVIPCMTSIEEYKSFHPFFLSEEEHLKLNEISPIFQMMKKGMDLAYQEHKTKIMDHDSRFTEEQILWAFMNNNTRSWLGLYLPITEMFNHSVRNGNINSSMEDKNIVISKKSYQSGEQVYISYGNKDTMILSYEYGFFDPNDYMLVLPLSLTFSGNKPVNYALARVLMEYGFKFAGIDENKNIMVHIGEMAQYQRKGKILSFSHEGISNDLYELFKLLSIQSLKELVDLDSPKERILQNLLNHVEFMIKNSTGTTKTTDLDITNKSKTFANMVQAFNIRMDILTKCRDWLSGQVQKNQVIKEKSKVLISEDTKINVKSPGMLKGEASETIVVTDNL